MYIKYNINPDKLSEPDCVCRAISLASGADYESVEYMLKSNGAMHDCEDLCLECYEKMLCEIGYPEIDAEDKSVSDLCRIHSNDKILVRIEGHLTCCINGNCYDIWDCTDRKADKYWLVTD